MKAVGPLLEGLEPEPVADDDEDWKLSVRLTLTEIVALARGELPASLVTYCQEGLRHWEGSPELAAVEAHERTKGRVPA